MIMKYIYLLFFIAFFGCATTTGIQQLAPNTYTLSIGVSGMGSISANDTKAKRDALSQASDYCVGRGRQILVQNTRMNSTYSGSTSELIFECITDKQADENSFTRYSRQPDLVIENRNTK